MGLRIGYQQLLGLSSWIPHVSWVITCYPHKAWRHLSSNPGSKVWAPSDDSGIAFRKHIRFVRKCTRLSSQAITTIDHMEMSDLFRGSQFKDMGISHCIHLQHWKKRERLIFKDLQLSLIYPCYIQSHFTSTEILLQYNTVYFHIHNWFQCSEMEQSCRFWFVGGRPTIGTWLLQTRWNHLQRVKTSTWMWKVVLPFLQNRQKHNIRVCHGMSPYWDTPNPSKPCVFNEGKWW